MPNVAHCSGSNGQKLFPAILSEPSTIIELTQFFNHTDINTWNFSPFVTLYLYVNLITPI